MTAGHWTIGVVDYNDHAKPAGVLVDAYPSHDETKPPQTPPRSRALDRSTALHITVAQPMCRAIPDSGRNIVATLRSSDVSDASAQPHKMNDLDTGGRIWRA